MKQKTKFQDFKFTKITFLKMLFSYQKDKIFLCIFKNKFTNITLS